MPVKTLERIEAATINRPMLIEALTNACRVTPKPSRAPDGFEILESVLIRQSGSGVKVIATDLDIVTTSFAEADCAPGFAVVTPARPLLNCLKAAVPARDVRLASTQAGATLDVGAVTYRLETDPEPEGFPANPGFARGLDAAHNKLAMPRSTLLPILTRCRPAMSKDSTRYYLNGLSMSVCQESLVMAATDGFRLVRWTSPCPDSCLGMPDKIVPAFTVNELFKILSQKTAPEEVLVSVSDEGIRFRIGAHQLLESRFVDGTFPDIARAIPVEARQVISFEPDRMIEAMNAVSCLNTGQETIGLSFHAGGIDVCLGSPETNGAKTTLVADFKEIEPFRIGVSRRQMKEILSTIGGRCKFSAADERSAILMRDTAAPEFIYVLMPSKI